MQKTIVGFFKTLKEFVFSAAVGVALLVFIGGTFASSMLYEYLREASPLLRHV